MPPTFCKDCSIKISGFFKKKFTCQLCANRFCDRCFSKVKEHAHELKYNLTELSGQNCLSCVVLQCSKIKREQLFLLENKQLALYLSERFIPTERCSEKYHLVDLIMDFAERHGIKSGDDLENECLHRNHVEELKRKAELLRIQEQRGQEENQSDKHESESRSDIMENDIDQPHFSGSNYGNNSSDGAEDNNHESDNDIPDWLNGEAGPTHLNANSNNSDRNDNVNQSIPVDETKPSVDRSFSSHPQAARKWRSLEDIQMAEDINALSVLELKQILTANFIDYRGCCEKKELRDKVTMLYQSREATHGDRDDRDLCKICMDRVIDCIFLDCAHLVACTKCGKNLTECPICRALIVRVVHIFRA